jgi:regulator of sirC expression with transglutaminase-like and TPR domain
MPPEKKAELFRENALNALAGKGCSADRAARSYPAQAQLIFSRELELHQSAFAYGQRARAEFYMGGEDNINKALADLEKAINLRNDDDDSPWYRGRAMIYLSLNKYREAVADAGKALKLHPEDMESRRIRADAYAKLDNYAKAADDMAYYFKHVNCPVCAEGASESSACKALAEHNKDVTGCKNLNYFTNKKRRTKSSFR